MKKVAIVGTVGLPAKYGGFETLTQNLVEKKCATNIQYTVFCSSKQYPDKQKRYKDAQLKYIPLKANGIQSTMYDIWSLFRSIRGFRVILILGVSGCVILPVIKLISRAKIIVNIDGLEHRRDKWGKYARKFLKFSEKIAVKNADIIISDNQAITDYIEQEYNRQSEFIAYGGDHALLPINQELAKQVYDKYELSPNGYSLAVCRIEPENNVHITLEAYATLSQEKLVFIGNWNNSVYGIELKAKYSKYKNLTLLDPIYDINILNIFRTNCKIYIHGHSAGGTNPSLVEAMFFQNSILCFDVCYNRKSTDNAALYYRSSSELISLIKSSDQILTQNTAKMNHIAQQRYTWNRIVAQYEQLY